MVSFGKQYPLNTWQITNPEVCNYRCDRTDVYGLQLMIAHSLLKLFTGLVNAALIAV